MNDSPVDIGIQNNFVEPGHADHRQAAARSSASVSSWITRGTRSVSSAVGYSRQDIDNTDGESATAFKAGQYTLGNLLYTPVPG